MRDISVLPKRILDKIRIEGECWIWTGHISNSGYGRLGRRWAHRVVYELLIGPIPNGLTIDHLCRVRPCVNPSHVEPVTRRVNNIRGVGWAGQNARKTHCLLGHEFTESNMYRLSTRPTRICKTCHLARVRRQYRAKRDQQMPKLEEPKVSLN